MTNVNQGTIRAPKCPHCSTPNPELIRMWASDRPMDGALTPPGTQGRYWGVFRCTTCGDLVLAKGVLVLNNIRSNSAFAVLEAILPESRTASSELPDVARTYLQQALDTLHAPDAAGLLSSSAIDAMLKVKGYTDGSLYTRIDKAVSDRLLTEGMGKWAHKVRLEANNVRHADGTSPNLTKEDAHALVEFAEALGDFLFVFTNRVERGLAGK